MKASSASKRFGQLRPSPALLKPWIPLSLNFVVFFAAYFLYEVKLSDPLMLLLVAVCSITALLVSFAIEESNRRWQLPEGKVNFPRTTAVVVVLCSCLEYLYFGVPLLGDTLYVEFGFPLVHHVVVSSWILLFTARTERSRMLRVALWLFALVNPVLMLNRDALLLTLFCALVLGLLDGKIKPRTLAVLAVLSLLAFSLVGQLRSPFALATVSLPFSIDVTEVSPLLMWPIIYITSSSFNMLANFAHLDLALFEDLINVFPESYVWATRANTYLAIPLYYALVAGLLWHVRVLSSRRPEWVPFYVYLVYQAYMSVFSTKVFTTNTIFVTLAIAMASALSSLKSPASRPRRQASFPA